MTSNVACHYRPWTTYTVKYSRAWHIIIALERNTWSNEVERGISSLPLDNTHDQTTSGLACHHGPWEAHTLRRRRSSHANIALGQQT